MFNDRYGLTEAVLTGRKTMTRRTAYDKPMKYEKRMGWDKDGYLLLLDGWEVVAKSRYRLNEFVAVAQSYNTLNKMGFVAPEWCEHTCEDSAGYKNKMFVRADLMPHRIRITDIKVERLRDISDEDCGKEGIVHVEWKQWLKQEWNDFSPQRYKTHDVWTLPIFEESLLDTWSEQNGHEIFATDPQTAFFVLFSALAGKRPNDMTVSNPWVFAYSFELVQ